MACCPDDLFHQSIDPTRASLCRCLFRPRHTDHQRGVWALDCTVQVAFVSHPILMILARRVACPCALCPPRGLMRSVVGHAHAARRLAIRPVSMARHRHRGGRLTSVTCATRARVDGRGGGGGHATRRRCGRKGPMQVSGGRCLCVRSVPCARVRAVGWSSVHWVASGLVCAARRCVCRDAMRRACHPPRGDP